MQTLEGPSDIQTLYPDSGGAPRQAHSRSQPSRLVSPSPACAKSHLRHHSRTGICFLRLASMGCARGSGGHDKAVEKRERYTEWQPRERDVYAWRAREGVDWAGGRVHTPSQVPPAVGYHQLPRGGSTHALTRSRCTGNLHAFTSLRACAVLDVLAPPYAPDGGRDCTYYVERRYALQTPDHINRLSTSGVSTSSNSLSRSLARSQPAAAAAAAGPAGGALPAVRRAAGGGGAAARLGDPQGALRRAAARAAAQKQAAPRYVVLVRRRRLREAGKLALRDGLRR
jgi:hypothetical protein